MPRKCFREDCVQRRSWRESSKLGYTREDGSASAILYWIKPRRKATNEVRAHEKMAANNYHNDMQMKEKNGKEKEKN